VFCQLHLLILNFYFLLGGEMKHIFLSLFVMSLLTGCETDPKVNANTSQDEIEKVTKATKAANDAATAAKDAAKVAEEAVKAAKEAAKAAEDAAKLAEGERVFEPIAIVEEFKNIRPHNAIKTSAAIAYGKDTKSKTPEVLHERSLGEILKQNYVLAELFIASADSAGNINNIGNATLLATAVAVAGAPAEAVVRTNRLLAGLFLSETLRFVSPRKAGDAFRKAASEALCFNKKTYTSKPPEGDDTNLFIIEGNKIKASSERYKAELLYAMQVSHGNLRIRLVRPQANLISLVGNFNDSKAEVKEQSIELSNELDVAEADAAITLTEKAEQDETKRDKKIRYLTYRKELLECLK
jgi:hypothetical protein